VTASDIRHFTAQAKMASISREFSGECFDFDRLSASCLGGLVSKREQKEAVSRLLDGKDVSVGGSCNWFWQEIELSCYSLPIFSASRALHHPYPRAFCTLQFRSHQKTKMAARRAQRSTSTISRKNRGL